MPSDRPPPISLEVGDYTPPGELIDDAMATPLGALHPSEDFDPEEDLDEVLGLFDDE